MTYGGHSLGALRILIRQLYNSYEPELPPEQILRHIGTMVINLRAEIQAIGEEFDVWGSVNKATSAGASFLANIDTQAAEADAQKMREAANH